MFCKHEWKLLSDTTQQSKAEHAASLGLVMTKGNSYVLERKHIQVFTCDKCGKLKRFVETL